MYNDKEERILQFLEEHHISQNENEVEKFQWYDEEDKVSFCFGECFGVMLKGEETTILVEDDGNWFRYKSNWFSSFWTQDLILVLKAVQEKQKTKIKK